MAPRKAILWVGVLLGLVLSASPASASAITFSAAGADIASITPTVDAFRAALGGNQLLGATNTLTDHVALDDFLFSEPQAAAAPEPSSLVLLATAVLLLVQGLLRKEGPFDLPRRWI